LEVALDEPFIFDELTRAVIEKSYYGKILSDDPYLKTYVDYLFSDEWELRCPFSYKER
jgi:hypothetical protein